MAGRDIPPEIVRHIVHLAMYETPQSAFGSFGQRRIVRGAIQYASVSRGWQDIVERETFAELHIDLNRLSQLNTIVTSRRRGFVRTIRLHAILPKPGPLSEAISHEEELRNDAALQATLEVFLQTLSHWTTTEMHCHGIRLFVDARASVRNRAIALGSEFEKSWVQSEHRRAEGSVLELTNPEGLLKQPAVEGIVELKSTDQTMTRDIAAAAMCNLLARLPSAKEISVAWFDGGGDDRLRSEFHDALSQVKHPMNTLHVAGTLRTPIRLPKPLSTCSEPKSDELSQTIHQILKRLRKCDLYHVSVTEEVFFPLNSINTAIPQFDRLEQLSINLLPTTPSGELLFDVSVALDSDDDISSSSVSMDSGLEPPRYKPGKAGKAVQRLYLAAARAALGMPLLKDMTLSFDLSLLGGDILEDWHKFSYSVRKSMPKAIWTSSSKFIPDDGVLEAWKKVPRKYLGTELDVEILDVEWAI